MSMSRKLKKKLLAAAATITMLSVSAANVNAASMPDLGTVAVGEVEVLHTGMTPYTAAAGMKLRTLELTGDTIMAMKNSLINWQLFNIGPGNNLTFNTNGYVLVNQVTDPNSPASEIYGGLYQEGTGHLFLINPSGIIVGGSGEVIGTGAITLAAVQTLSTDQFNALSAGNAITLTPTGNVTFNNNHASVDNQLNLLGKAVSDGGAHREKNDINATEAAKFKLENNMLVKDGDTPGPTPPGPTPPGPTPPGPTPDVGPKTEEEAKQFVDQTKGSVDTLTESQRGNDSAVKAAQEALMNAQDDGQKKPTVNDSSLTGVQDHVYVVQTGAEQNNIPNITQGLQGLTVQEVSARSRNLAKQYMDALNSGDKAKADQLKEALKDANRAVKLLKEEEKLTKETTQQQTGEGYRMTPEGERELAEKEAAEKAAMEKALKDAQERFDKAQQDAREKLQAWKDSQKELENAQAKAELAARDYLNALKTGDPEIIAAYKERLQEANDNFLAAQRNEAAAQEAMREASYKVFHEQSNLQNVKRDVESGIVPRGYLSQGSGTGQTVVQQTGENNLSSLEQKYNDLYKQTRDLDNAKANASLNYLDAKEAGASPEELARLQAEYDRLDKERNAVYKEQEAAKAELDAARTQQGGSTSVVETGGQSGLNIGGERPVVETETTRPRTGASQQTMQGKISALEQKYNDLHNKTDELLLSKADASLAYLNAKEAGASPEELARLQAEYDRLQKEVDTAFKEQDAAKADLNALRAQQWEQMPPQEKIPVLEQKYNDLHNKTDELLLSKADASLAYLNAKEAGASPEELARLQAEYDRLQKEVDTAFKEQDAAKAELSALRAQQGEQRTSVVETGGQSGLNIGGGERPVVETETTRPRTGTSQQTTQEKVSVLEQKYKELDETVSKLVSDVTDADLAYMKAEDAGASQEELDRLKAERAQIANKRDAVWEERRVAEAELNALRDQQAEQQSQSQQAEQQNQSQAVMEREWLDDRNVEKELTDSERESIRQIAEMEAKELMEWEEKDRAEAKQQSQSQAEMEREWLNDRNVEKELTDSERESIRQIAEMEAKELMEWEEKDRAEAKQQSQSQQGGVTSVVETGGQSGLNIGGARPVVETETTRPRTGTSQQTMQEKVSVLEQKYKELDETVSKLVSDITDADLAYMKAKDAGASQEELDRLKAERAQIANKRDAIWEERDAAKAELKDAKAQQWEQMPVSEKIPVLEQKFKELDENVSKLVSDVTSADVAYMKAEDAGASQEELDRLKAERAQIANKRDAIWEERDAAKAELNALRDQQAEQTVIKPLDNQLSELNLEPVPAGPLVEPLDNQLSELSPVGIERLEPIAGASLQSEQQQSGGEAAKAAEPKQQTVEQPTQQQSGETMTTELNSAEQAAKDAAVKAAQEKLDQYRKEGFDKYAALQKAQHDVSSAEEKAEKAANDYLLALKSGDKYTIDAFKEELQKANDALLEAKRNEEAAQQKIQEVGSNIERARTELDNAQNNFNDSGAAGGENQQTTQQQTVGQQTTQQTVEQPVQQQSGGETAITTQDPLKSRVTELEQKVNDLTKQYRDGFDARDQANLDYLDAKERGASQEEIDRLKAKYDELAKEQGRILDERRTAKAELQAAREAANAAEPIQQQSGGESNITAELSKMTPAEKVSNLEQKINDLDDKVTDATIASGSALNDYFEAQNRGASQEELDSLKAKYNELDSARDKLDAQRDDAKARLEAARAEANAAE